MAKGKHSVALFEVISSSRGRERPAARPPIFRAPRWMSLRRRGGGGSGGSGGQDPTTERAPTAEEIAADPTLKPITVPTRLDATGAPVVVGRVVPQPAPAPPAPVVVETPAEANDPWSADGDDLLSSVDDAPRRGRRAPFSFDVNSDRQEIVLRMRYTAAVLTGFTVLVLIGLAYVTGRQTAQPAPQLADGVSTDLIRRGPVHPTVMNVGDGRDLSGGRGRGATARADGPAFATEQTAGPVTSPEGTELASPAADRQPPQVGAAVEQNARRIIGLNYVLVQSYPDAVDAEKACEVLRRAGIEATVERGLSFAPSRYCVVGTLGFASPYKTRPEYQQYVKAIERASATLGSRSSLRHFEPTPLKWQARG